MSTSTLISSSDAMASISATVDQIVANWSAGGRLSLLLLGSTGVGKGEIAHEVARRLGDEWHLVRIDCSARGDMLRDDLLGHARGAFTGASTSRAGLASRASSGVLFLDEVGDLRDEDQRVLRDLLGGRGYFPIGSDKPVTLDARVISATNKDLLVEAKAGRFRHDLYHRLARRVVVVPDIAERPEDIEPLARELAGRTGIEVDLAPECSRVLRGYSWPGNVRELETVIECSAAVVGPGGTITPDVIEEEIRRLVDASARADAMLSGDEPQRTIVLDTSETAARSLTPDERKAIALHAIRKDGSLTPRRLAELCGCSRCSASKTLSALLDSGDVRRRGMGRATVYVCS